VYETSPVKDDAKEPEYESSPDKMGRFFLLSEGENDSNDAVVASPIKKVSDFLYFRQYNYDFLYQTSSVKRKNNGESQVATLSKKAKRGDTKK
jgi:hypothetical protein